MFEISPLKVLQAGALLLILGLIGWRLHEWGAHKYEAGQADVQAKWDHQKTIDAAAASKLQAAANRVSTKIVTKYIDRVQVVREKSDVIVRQVPVYLPAGLPLLPGGFRLLHDAAAANEPIPAGASADDEAPTDPQTATAAVTGNYGTYHEVAAELTSLQDWVYAQCLNNPPPEGCTAPYD